MTEQRIHPTTGACGPCYSGYHENCEKERCECCLVGPREALNVAAHIIHCVSVGDLNPLADYPTPYLSACVKVLQRHRDEHTRPRRP